MPSISCPMPTPVDYKKAVEITEQVRKEMPNLKTKEAIRREAARRAGLDYVTFNLIRGRKLKSAVPGQATTAVTTTSAATTAARAATRSSATAPRPTVVKAEPPVEVGQFPGTPALRTELQKFIDETPGIEHGFHIVNKKVVVIDKGTTLTKLDVIHRRLVGSGKAKEAAALRRMMKNIEKGGAPTARGPVAKKIQEGKPKHTPQAIGKVLEGKGLKKSTKSKERFDHRGNAYGGGTSTSRGYKVERLPGSDDYKVILSQMKPVEIDDLVDALKSAGYDVDRYMSVITVKAPAKSIDEMVESFHADLVKSLTPSKRSKMSGGWESDLRQMLQHMADADPDVFRTLKSMTWESKARVNGSFSMYNRDMRLNPSLFTSQGRWAAQNSQAIGWHVPRASHKHKHNADGTALHEMGHAFHATISHADELRLYRAVADEWGIPWHGPALARFDDFAGMSVQQARFGEAGWMDAWFDAHVSPTAKRYLSQYGGANRMEFLAEVYVNWKTQGANAKAIAKKLGPMMDKMMRRF